MLTEAKRKVLVIEDSEADRYTARAFLTSTAGGDFDVVEAETGEDGLALSRSSGATCVLLDDELPDMTGMDLLRQLRTEDASRYLPVVMLTSRGDELLAIEALRTGAQDYLPKSRFSAEELGAVVGRAIQRAQLTKELEEERAKLRRANADLEAALAREATARITLSAAQRAASAGVWDWDLVTGEVFVSDEYRELYDLLPEEAVTFEQWVGAIHPDDRARVTAASELALASGEEWHEEFRVQLPRKGERWLAGVGRIRRDATGVPQRFTGFTFDITGHKRAEEALRERDHQYRALVQEISDGVFVVQDERFVLANPALPAMLGYGDKGFEGLSVEAVVEPEFLEIWTQRLNARLTRSRDEVESYEVQFQGRGNLPSVWLDLHLHRIDYAGRPAVLGIARNISARKAEEAVLATRNERLRLLARAAALLLEPVAVQDILPRLLEMVMGHLGFEVYMLQMAQPDGTLRLSLAHGLPAASEATLRERRVEERLCASVARLRTSRLMEQIQSDLSPQAAFLRDAGLSSYVCQPLIAGDQLFGTLGFGYVLKQRIDLSEIQFLRTISQYVALAFQREATERALRDSQASLALALRAGKAGAWEWKVADNTLNWSEEMYDLYGRLPSDVPLRYDDWARAIHPEDLSDTEAAVRETLSGASPELRTEFRVLHPERGLRRLLGVGRTVLDADGVPVRLLGINIDITDLKEAEAALGESEARLSLALDGAGLATWEVDPVTGDTLWSARKFEMVGLPMTSDGRVPPGIFSSLLHPEDREQVLAAVAHARKVGVPFASDYRVIRADTGQIRWLSSYGRFSYGADGEALRFAGVTLDDSERRELRRGLEQAQKLQAVGRLAGGLAHEINNMMTVVLGYGSFALEQLEPAHRARPDLIQALGAGERAADITHQLLAFTKQKVLSIEPLDLSELVRRLAPMLTPLLGAEIALELALAPVLPKVAGDRSSLEQVLVNLAVNARDAMPGGGRLSISSSAVELGPEDVTRRPGVNILPGRYVRLVVEDTGVGMDEAVLSRAFEPFFTTRAVGEGTGLGLSTAYGIVKQLGGYIWASSVPGKGSTIVIELPVQDPSSPDADPPDGFEPPNRLVLVVEDEPAVRALIQRALEHEGYSVVTAADGPAAMAFLEHRGREVHLVLTDAVMPGMSGRELARRIAHIWPMPVVYMSASSEAELVQRDLLDPAAPFVAKPFAVAELARVVASAIASSREPN